MKENPPRPAARWAAAAMARRDSIMAPIIKRLQTEQCLARGVALVSIENDAQLRRATTHSLNAVYIFAQVPSHLDFNPGDVSLDCVLRQFIGMFWCDHWNTHICFHIGSSTTQENV